MKYIGLLVVLFFMSCDRHEAPKPKVFVEENIMIDIMYDLTIVQAIKSTGEYVLADSSLEVKNLLRDKYKIDEKTWIANNKYYASNLKKYNAMIAEVHQRLEKQKLEMEPKVKKVEAKSQK